MTQEEILDYNRRCALFIGGKQAKDTLPFVKERLNENDYWLPIFGIKSLNQMKFHSDWNWIMEVVEAIEDLDIVASFQIEQPTIYIWKSSEESTFEYIEVNIFTMSKKEAVVQAINQFLIWYNNEQRT